MTYYPLTVGNQWIYKQKDGSLFTNTITKADTRTPKHFVIVNSIQNLERLIRKEGPIYYTNNFDGDNFQILLKDDPILNDTWEVHFIANGLNNILVMKVKE